MSEKENPTKEVKCPCGINTVVDIKPSTTYCELTRFVCECGNVFHIIDYMNGCICYYLPSPKVDKEYMEQVAKDELRKAQEIKHPVHNVQKECFNHCPECNATDPNIIWGDKDWSDQSAWQNATCKKCGCEFTEVYTYAFSEIDESVEPLPHPSPDS